MIFKNAMDIFNIELKMDIYPVCSTCESILETEDDHHNCNYWFHQQKRYGNYALAEYFCEKCITKHNLYDGRVDSVCKRCERYVEAFVLYPKFLEICILLFRESDGFDITEIVENEQLIEIFAGIENCSSPEDFTNLFGSVVLGDILEDVQEDSSDSNNEQSI
jgi:hypothetical protein